MSNRIVKISNPATGLVFNRHGNLKVKPAKGDALTLFTDTGSNDQRFEEKYKGDYAYYVLQSNPALVINRHKITGDLMLWPLAESTDTDILFNTETVDGNVRLMMPHYKQYATAPNLYVGGNIETEANREHNGTQFFAFVEVKAAGGATTGSDERPASTNKILDVPLVYQMQWSGTHCLAATLLGLCKFYGHNIGMDALVSKGCVRKSDGYVNTPSPFVSWTRTGYNLSESAYCAAITAQINQGAPVVVKMAGSAGDHYVTCVSGGSTPDAIQVNDPMVNGRRTTLRAAFNRKGQKYEHFRTTKKL